MTERQQQASRENGSKSHGPVTQSGKLNSSQNALKHGMLSGTLVLKCESTDRFENLLATLFEEFQPQTPFEESLIEDMAVARWRRMRIRGMEKAAMDYEMGKQSDTSHPISTEDSATRAQSAFRTLSDESRALELINRYDSRYQREYLRAHRRFLEVRDRRTPPVPQESEISKGTPEVAENKPEPDTVQSEPHDAGMAEDLHSSPVAPTVLPSVFGGGVAKTTDDPIPQNTIYFAEANGKDEQAT